MHFIDHVCKYDAMHLMITNTGKNSLWRCKTSIVGRQKYIFLVFRNILFPHFLFHNLKHIFDVLQTLCYYKTIMDCK